MKRLKLALLYGGSSSEREVSISGWKVVRAHFDPDRYLLFDFDLKTDLTSLASKASELDAAFICVHGRGGEDGTLQGFLEQLGLPYQGSGVLAGALAMNKKISKALFRQAGLDVPEDMVINRRLPVDIALVESRIGFPLMVKPVREGSSIGMSLVRSPSALQGAIETAFEYDDEVLVEEYLQGVEITGAVLGNNRLKALPLVEIIPGTDHEFFDLHAKYTPGATEEICPARLNEELSARAREIALAAHRALDCRGYSRVDMFVVGDRIKVLEVNTIPGMTQTSLFPQAAKASGLEFSRLLDTLVDLALGRELPD